MGKQRVDRSVRSLETSCFCHISLWAFRRTSHPWMEARRRKLMSKPTSVLPHPWLWSHPTTSHHVGSSHFGSAITYSLWFSGLLTVVCVQESQLNLSMKSRPGEGNRDPAHKPLAAYWLLAWYKSSPTSDKHLKYTSFPNQMLFLEGCRTAFQVSFPPHVTT